MAYVGREPIAGEVIVLDSIESSFNGSLTSFSLTRTINGTQSPFYPKETGQLMVSLGGVIQKPDLTGNEGFKISYDQIVFAVAPPASTTCFIISYGNVLDVGGGLQNVNVTAGKGLSGGGTITTTNGGTVTLDIDIAQANDPSSGNVEGDIIFNTTANKLKVYDGSAWKKVGGGAGEELDALSEEIRYYIPTATLSTTGTVQETTTNATDFFTPASTVTIADTTVITVADGNTLTIGEEPPKQQPLVVRGDGVGIYRPSMNAALTIRSDFTKPNLSGYVTPRINFQGPRGSTSVASYSIAVTNPSSGLYGLSGTDRNGSVSGNNVTVTIAAGDTITFNNSVHTNHPLRIRVSDAGADVFTPAATGQGTATVAWTPDVAGTYYYQCANHPAMIGTIVVLGAAGGAITQYATIQARGSGLLDPTEVDDGHLEFYTRQNNNLAKQSTLHRNGDLELHNGGIRFANTTTYNSNTQDTLSRFEEGFWTPYLSDSSLSLSTVGNLNVTYNNVSKIGASWTESRTHGSYTRMGNLVYVMWDMYISSYTTSGSTSNQLTIKGFPFPGGYGDFGTTWNRPVLRASSMFNNIADGNMIGWMNKGYPSLQLTQSTGASETNILVSDLNQNGRLTGWLMYHTND